MVLIKRCVNLSVNIVMIFFSFWHFYFILFFCTGHEECMLYYATFPWVPPLGVPLQNDNMKAHIYFYQIIQFWNYTIITYCSSALDTIRSVSTKILHFLEHRPSLGVPCRKTTCKPLTIIFGIYIPFIYAYVMLVLLHWTRGGV